MNIERLCHSNMGKYDFDKVWERNGRNAIKWDINPLAPRAMDPSFTPLPMWVADMDFATAPSVTEAMQERLNHPLFGYYGEPDRYYNAIFNWQKNRFGVTGLKKDNIGYENGVLGGVAAVMHTLTKPGDPILVHAPTYVGFTGVLKNNDMNIVSSELKQDADGVYRMDFDDMEKKIKENGIQVAIFCNPHNPTGRSWTKEEIVDYIDLMAKYGITVISDEIWADFMIGEGQKHIPTQSVSDTARRITCAFYAPSKTFNLAGLVGSYHVIYNQELREKVLKTESLSHYNSHNIMSTYALIGGYEGGAEWVDELCAYVRGNMQYCEDYCKANLPGVKFTVNEGAYVALLDCGEWLEKTGLTMDNMLDDMAFCGVLVSDGRAFHADHHVRINFACPRANVEQMMERLDKYVFNKKR